MHQTLTETLKYMLDEDSEIDFLCRGDGAKNSANEIASKKSQKNLKMLK